MKTTKIKELEKAKSNLLKSEKILMNLKNSNIAAALHHINNAIDMIDFEIVYINKTKS